MLLAVSGVLAIGALFSQVSLRAKTTDVIDNGIGGLNFAARANALSDAEDTANALARIVLVAIVVTGIVFVVWFYRVVANLAATGRWRGGSIGMAAGSWFIPIANVFIPIDRKSVV